MGEGWSGLACGHALTRSVRDSAALLDVTSGPAPGDPYWAPPPTRPFLQEVGAKPGKLRIALMVEKGIPEIGVRQRNPDFIKLGKAFGCRTVKPTSLARFKSALATAFAADGPTLIEVREDAAFLA